MSQSKYRKALDSWAVYGILVCIILISIYIVALIIPDSITMFMAEKIGYGMIAIIIVLVVGAMYLISVSEAEKQELIISHEVSKRKINELEEELTSLKNRK